MSPLMGLALCWPGRARKGEGRGGGRQPQALSASSLPKSAIILAPVWASARHDRRRAAPPAAPPVSSKNKQTGNANVKAALAGH